MRDVKVDAQAYYRALVGVQKGTDNAARSGQVRRRSVSARILSATLRELGARAARRLEEARQRLAA